VKRPDTNPLHVFKVGGSQVAEPSGLEALGDYLLSLIHDNVKPVIVHGGGHELSDLQAQLGEDPRKELGLRVTTERGMSLATMVLCGLVNKRIVAHLQARGRSAVGLCGADFGFMTAEFLNRARLGRVGGPPRVDPAPIHRLLDEGCVVVVAPVCAGSDGGLVNVNADTVARALAVSLEADILEFITDVDAVRDHERPLQRLPAGDIEALVAGPAVRGGMVPKLQACLAAIEGGVARVRVGSVSSLADGQATEVRP
jgi:acetylglutamate kinase